MRFDRFDAMARAVAGTVWELPPARLARFLVSTAKPGEYAEGVKAAHARDQRTKDENTMKVLASMTLWASRSETPECEEEAQTLLKAFSEQSDIQLAQVLDPHSATVAKALMTRHAS